MDFHTLSRRDLQALCKKNKIPANTTNVAMADALQALQTVEGLEDFLTHGADYLKTPAKSIAATPAVSRRTSFKEEPESSKLTRTARGTRKAEVETAQSKRDVPALPSAYTTRRSTRLLEKQMDQLSLKDDSSQVMQRQFSEDMEKSLVSEGVSETQTCSDESSVTKPGEEPTVENMDLLENEASSLDCNKKVEAVNVTGACDVECTNEVEEPVKEEGKKEDDQPMIEEDVVEQVSEAEVSGDNFETQDRVNEEEDQPMLEVDVVGKATETEVSTDNLETQDRVNEEDVVGKVTEAEDSSANLEAQGIEEVSAAMNEDMLELESESSKAEDVIAPPPSSSIIPEAIKGEDAVEEVMDNALAECGEEDEFGFLSEGESEEEEAVEESVESEEVEAVEKSVEKMKNSGEALSGSARRVHFSDNKENPAMKAAVLVVENASLTAGTPIDKKSLRKLKKMIKERYQEKQRPAPLQVRTQNV